MPLDDHQESVIAELRIQRSGCIVDKRTCTLSFQAVIPWLFLFTLQKRAKYFLSYTTRRCATVGVLFRPGYSELGRLWATHL
jgi:hypothetical protein